MLQVISHIFDMPNIKSTRLSDQTLTYFQERKKTPLISSSACTLHNTKVQPAPSSYPHNSNETIHMDTGHYRTPPCCRNSRCGRCNTYDYPPRPRHPPFRHRTLPLDHQHRSARCHPPYLRRGKVSGILRLR